MAPSIGRIVHYEDTTGVVKPAIITKVWPDSATNLVNLYVFPTSQEDSLYGSYTSVPQADQVSGLPDQHLKWFWPPMIPTR